MAAKKSPAPVKQQGTPLKPAKKLDITENRKKLKQTYDKADSTEKVRIRKLLTRFQ